jgi:putative transposase
VARLSRLAIDHQLHHLVHRARPGVDLLRADADRTDYLVALLDVSRELGVAIHAYALLPSRVQLLLTPGSGPAIASMMQRVGRRFVGAYNQRHGMSGSPWLGRYRTAVLQPGAYLLAGMHHVELAPVDAGLVTHPAEWRASSAAHHLGLRMDPLITDHPAYFELGNTPFEREASYRLSMDRQQTVASRRAVDDATEKGWALGSDAFLSELLKLQARRLRPRPRGRPSSVTSDPEHSVP